MANIIFIDNFDSFTYNIVEQFIVLNHKVNTYNNTITAQEIEKLVSKNPNNTIVVIGPGPGNPQEAGNILDIIKTLQGKTPILGICLGHQAICQVFGAKVVLAPEKAHGKSSSIIHTNDAIYNGLDNPLTVSRYHSLMVTGVSEDFEVNGYTQENNIIMSVRHKNLPIVSFQYHPESVMTINGAQLLEQTIDYLLNFITTNK